MPLTVTISIVSNKADSVALTFILAPVPNAICARRAGMDDFSEGNSAYIDFGRFVTGMLVVSHTFSGSSPILAQSVYIALHPFFTIKIAPADIPDDRPFPPPPPRSFRAHSARSMLDVHSRRRLGLWHDIGILRMVRRGRRRRVLASGPETRGRL